MPQNPVFPAKGAQRAPLEAPKGPETRFWGFPSPKKGGVYKGSGGVGDPKKRVLDPFGASRGPVGLSQGPKRLFFGVFWGVFWGGFWGIG